MHCDINVKRDMRDALADVVEANKDMVGTFGSDGESRSLTDEFYRAQINKIHNPDSMLDALRERAEELTKPFHKALRRELGEEVYVDGKKAYLLGSRVLKNDDYPAGMEFQIRVAYPGNLDNVETLSFSMVSDTAMDGVGKSVGTVEGISDIFTKALEKHINKLRSNKASVDIDYEGNTELKETLTKMTQADVILDSRQPRKAESLIGYEKVKDYKHGDVDSMKQIMAKLHVLGRSKASDKLLGYYNGLIDKMHPRFFNEMSLYVRKGAAEPYGSVNLTKQRIDIDVATSKSKKGAQSEAEVYVHELVHTMTAWALRQKQVSVSGIRTQLNHAMAIAKANTTWQDFLPVGEGKATQAQIATAKEMHSYVFASENAMEEFIAYTLTNPAFMEKMQKVTVTIQKEKQNVFQRIVSLFSKLVDSVLGRYDFRKADATVFDAVNDLAFRLAELNVEKQNELDRMNPLGQIMDVVNNADAAIGIKLERLKRKIANKDKRIKIPPKDASVFAEAKFLMELAVKAFTNPIYRGFMGLWASALGMRPDGTIREILSSFTDKDALFRIAEKMNMLSNQVDAMRNGVINATHKALTSAFSRRLTEDEDKAITRVLLDTNLAALRYKRTKANKQPDTDIVKLLTDEDYRYTREGRVKHKIKELLKSREERANWTVAQAVGLGYYMATHKAHVAQNFNAYNIEKGFGLNERFEPVPGLAPLIDELATLVALKHTGKKDKVTVAGLIKTERVGINKLTDSFEAYRRESLDVLFKGNTAHFMAGHTKELFDDTIDISFAPLSQRAELESKGFVYRYTLPAKNGDSYKSPMAVYTTPSWGKAERLRGTVGLGRLHAKGTSMSSLKALENYTVAEETFGRDFARVRLQSNLIHQSMAKGTFDVTAIEYGMAPVVNQSGMVTDFRYMMSKEQKETLLKQDVGATQVLARSVGSIVHNTQREELNGKALSFIKKDMKVAWDGGTVGKDGFTEYSLIGPNVPDPEMRELFRMLPDDYRDFIMSRSDKTMAIRTEYLRMFFGSKHLQLSKMKGVNLLPGFIKSVIDTMEGLWMELVKVSKATILMKMPIVLVENILSNIRYMITTGSIDVVELARDYRDSYREIDEYITTNRKITALQLEIQADNEALRRVKNNKALEQKIYEKTVELQRLNRVLESNPSYTLFKYGMYQTHVEDMDNSALSETNKISKYVNGKLDKAPGVVKTAVEYAYLTQNTGWYKAAQEVLQRTDMVARLVENKREIRKEVRMSDGALRLPAWWLAEKGKDYPATKKMTGKERDEFLRKAQDVRINGLIDHYINYTLPNGSVEEYLNRMGVLMFTKYLKRVQKVVMDTAWTHPIKTSFSVLLGAAFPSTEIFQDQSLLARGFGSNGEFSLSNMVPVYSPLYHLENVLTPAIVRDELYMGLL